MASQILPVYDMIGTFTAVKKTVSRVLLLVVSMGYGVVRPTLGGITYRVAALAIIYILLPQKPLNLLKIWETSMTSLAKRDYF